MGEHATFGDWDAESTAQVSSMPSVPSLMMSVLDPPAGEVFDASKLRDRVTIMLLFEQVVQLDQIRAVWPLWRAMQEAQAVVPLWRLIAIHASVDSEKVFEMAARVYSFERVDIPSAYNVLRFVREHRSSFTPAQWEQMYELSILPVDLEYPNRDQEQWVFATYDPGHPAIGSFLDDLNVDYCVRYALYSTIDEALQAVFPERDGAGPILGPADVFGMSITEANQEAASPQETEVTSSVSHTTLLNAFEDALTGMVREGRQTVYLIPNAASEIEVYTRGNTAVQHERTWADIPARPFFTFMRRRIIGDYRGEGTETPTKEVHRWIDGRRRSFQVQLRPVRDPAQGIDTMVVSVEYRG